MGFEVARHLVLLLFAARTPLRRLVVVAADRGLSAYSVRIVPGGWFGRAKSHGILAACFLLPVIVVGAGVG